MRISRDRYARLYGPTAGDRFRLADTELVAEVERNLGVPGEEAVFGGGKTIRDGMAQSQRASAEGALDLVITNVVVFDPLLGIVKGDLGVKEGRIAGLGNADASNVQVDAIAGLPFQNIQVVDAAGFNCSVTTSTEGVVPGHWLACTGGQVPAGGRVLIKLKANAPTAPSFHKMVTSAADPHNTIVELNGESDNHHAMTFYVS